MFAGLAFGARATRRVAPTAGVLVPARSWMIWGKSPAQVRSDCYDAVRFLQYGPSRIQEGIGTDRPVSVKASGRRLGHPGFETGMRLCGWFCLDAFGVLRFAQDDRIAVLAGSD